MPHPEKKKRIAVTLSIFFFILLTIYGIWQGRDILFGIKIQTDLQENLTTELSPITIDGKARHAKSIRVNGYTISVSEEGVFSHTLALLPGMNTVGIEAENKFGKVTEKTYQIYYLGEVKTFEEGENHDTIEDIDTLEN